MQSFHTVANPGQKNHGNYKRQPRIVTYSLRGPYLISSPCFMKNVNIIGQKKIKIMR